MAYSLRINCDGIFIGAREPEHPIKFVLVNLNSLINKVSFLNDIIKDNKVSLAVVCETWLINSIPSSFVAISGFNFFRCDTASSVRKHGVGVYVDSKIRTVQIDCPVPNLLVLNLTEIDVFVIAVYRPPSNTDAEDEELKRFLSQYCLGRRVIVMGDFNLPSLRWSGGLLQEGYVTPSDRAFYQCFIDAGLTQLVSEPTFIPSGNVLDLCLVSCIEDVGGVEILPPLPRCHHSPVLLDLLLMSDTAQESDFFAIMMYNKANFAAISRELAAVDWGGLFEDKDANECFELFLTHYNQLVDIHVPLKEVKLDSSFKRPPRSLLNNRREAWKDYLVARREHGRRSDAALHAWDSYAHMNQQYRNFAILKQKEYEERLASDLVQRPKCFHAYVRRKRKGRAPIGPLKEENRIISDDSAMSNLLVGYFGSVFQEYSGSEVAAHQTCDGIMEGVRIEYADVCRALSNLKADGSPGPDKIHPQILRSCNVACAFPLHLIMVKSFRDGILPDKWKKAIVVPIFKDGSRYQPQNYRPVSMTSIPCKTMERLLVEHITRFLELNSLLAANQFGFRRGRGTEDQLLIMYDQVVKEVVGGNMVDVVYLDFSKAFDLVSHRILIEKLRLLGFDEQLIVWIRAFLVNRSMAVRVNGKVSEEVPVGSGVPQGSVLGPLLFLVYVNHIARDVVGQWTAFADDFKLSMAYSRNSTDGLNHTGLQADLDSLCQASRAWNLRLNSKKCVVMRFGAVGMSKQESNYIVNNQRLKFVNVYKDLGVRVDVRLRFHEHVNVTCGKAAGLMNSLLRSTICRSSEFMVTLWVSHIRPIIEYGSCVWNVGYLQDRRRLESLLRRWTREVDGLGALDYVTRLKTLKLYSVSGRLLRSDLTKVWKCFHQEEDSGLLSIVELANNVGTRGNVFKLAVPITRTEMGRRKFGARVVFEWNSLPTSVVELCNISTFKKKMDEALGDKLFEIV